MMERTPAMNVEVDIPTDMQQARAILLEGSHGMFKNLPQPSVKANGGHACFSLKELLKQICANKVPIEFTEGPDINRKTNHIHGSKAMTELLQNLEMSMYGKPGVYYGYMIFRSDGFLTSYMEQEENSVWLKTVTFADPQSNGTSPYNTYCLAV